MTSNSNVLTAFEANEDGEVTFVYNPLFPKIGSYQKIPWYETIWVQLGILLFCGILFLSAIWFWGWQGKKKNDRTSSSFAQWLVVAVSGLNLLFIFGLPLSLWWIGFWKLAYGVPAIVVALLAIPLLTAVLTLALVVFTAIAWKDKFWSLARRIHYSLATLAAVIFIPFLAFWNLLGFQF